ncbi:DUF6053 domain-containing protein [Lysobacter yananisis]|uniref:DUF6053 domain-containing protein n=1 Tax=Lysobacter yananisis TaxID=1003114 RepID=UPI003CE48166
MGGPSGPTLSGPIAVIWNKSVGPEGPPARAEAAPSAADLTGSGGNCARRVTNL